MEKKYWQMKGGEAKRDWDGWQSVSLSSLFWLMEYSCCILNIPHNLLPNIWPRVHIGTHSPYFLSVTNPLCVLTYFHIFLLFNTSLFFNLFHFSHLSSFSFVLLLSVMTHWMCPDCGVPSICIHGIFGGGGGVCCHNRSNVSFKSLCPIKEKKIWRSDNNFNTAPMTDDENIHWRH